MSAAARAIIHAALRRIEGGRLELRESFSGRAFAFGPAGSALWGEAIVHDPAFYGCIARHRGIGLGTSYADGLWDSPDVVAVLRVAAREIGRSDDLRRWLRRLGQPLRRLRPDALRNTVAGARRNIAAHYDLGNELFELFLDRDLMIYSCALFADEDDSLEAAQRAKADRVCRALELGPDAHVLEIGGGWGGLAMHAAAHYGCRVTTTTISAEQRAYAEARIRSAGLDDRVRVIGGDYRELEGRFDRVASIEMIEAVGWQYLDRFFARCSELLAPDGLMFLQAICTDDRAYEAEKDAPTFSNRLIFPGGCLPSVEAIARALAAGTDMRTVWLADISPSYVLTLRAWRERFGAAEARLVELGYDRRFRRLWDLYFAISEAGFAEARIMDVQMLCAKPARRFAAGRATARPEPLRAHGTAAAHR
jgi:cyclopropane-fatty-acyl-phospholipid synthase